jgi:hypothetical protein
MFPEAKALKSMRPTGSGDIRRSTSVFRGPTLPPAY